MTREKKDSRNLFAFLPRFTVVLESLLIRSISNSRVSRPAFYLREKDTRWNILRNTFLTSRLVFRIQPFLDVRFPVFWTRKETISSTRGRRMSIFQVRADFCGIGRPQIAKRVRRIDLRISWQSHSRVRLFPKWWAWQSIPFHPYFLYLCSMLEIGPGPAINYQLNSSSSLFFSSLKSSSIFLPFISILYDRLFGLQVTRL